MKCKKCKKMGHHQKICKSKVVTQDDSQQKNVAHVADHEEEELFVATCLAANHSNDKWLIDSACTNHMTFDRDLFKELDTSFISKVKIGNGEYIAAEGKGTVAIETLKGTKFIREVLFVPDVSQNLLSVGQLLENGFKLFFESNHCLIKNSKDEDIFRVRMKGKSFALEPLQATQSVYSAVTVNAEVWHRRLGHFHHRAVVNMQKNELVRDLPNLEVDLPECNAC